MKVAVISGGFSEERKSSRETGECVAKAIKRLGHTVTVIEYDGDLLENLKKASPDAAFPLVQGKHHGDGAVQALLELVGVPYVGSRPYAAAIINHKTICKKIWRSDGIPIPSFFEYSIDEYEEDGFDDFAGKAAANEMKLPVVVKAPTQGNRYGIIFVKDAAGFDMITNAFSFDDTLLVETYVPGRFYTHGVVEIDGRLATLPPVEVIDGSDNEFKMYPGGSATRPHDLTLERVAEIDKITLKAADLTGASGFARLDYHLCGSKLYLIEINAVPGLVPGYSSMGECAAAAGYEYDEFIAVLLATARKRL